MEILGLIFFVIVFIGAMVVLASDNYDDWND